MSEKIVTPRDVFGWTIGTIIVATVTGALGWLTGSFPVVWEFAVSHPFEAVLWTVLLLLIGIAIGMLARGHFAKKRHAARYAEIAEPENRSKQGQSKSMVERLRAYEDADLRLAEEVSLFPENRRRALRYICEGAKGAFQVDTGSLLLSELYALEVDGFATTVVHGAFSKSWTVSGKGSRAWSLYLSGAADLPEDPFMDFLGDTVGTREHEMKHLGKWERQAILLLIDHPWQHYSEGRDWALRHALPSWAYRIDFEERAVDLTDRGRDTAIAIGIDGDKRLYEDLAFDGNIELTIMDKIASKIEVEIVKKEQGRIWL